MLSRLSGNSLAALALLIPAFGCLMAILSSNNLWLLLLAPAIVYMEGGLFIIGSAFVLVSIFGKGL